MTMKEAYYNKFDEPEYELFKSKGFKEDWSVCQQGSGEQLAMETIPDFLRSLLVTDGTVTKSLEAYFWEPVEIDTQSQELERTTGDVPWLKMTGGEEVLTREVTLRGANSGKIYAGAYSLIRPQAIPEKFLKQLIAGQIGIGVLIRDSGLESYREVVEFGAESGSANYYNCRSESGLIDVVFRTYRIFLGGKPAMLITERFPRVIYE